MKNPKYLNMVIVSMASKQKAMDKLKSKLFNLDVFTHYIDILIQINLNLMKINQKNEEKYKYLINQYLEGKIKGSPSKILEKLEQKEEETKINI
ncbi:MAG: hypothetical protein ACOC4G_01415 [Bacillota bacterium]